jgi:transcriptional regulator with XRE-family HTH domain
LGRFFEKLREARGFASQRNAARIAKQRGFTAISYQVLQRLEAGRTRFPEPEVLRALAELYNAPYELLVARSVMAIYGIALEHLPKRIDELLRQQAGIQRDVIDFARRINQLPRGARDVIRMTLAGLEHVHGVGASSERRKG